MRKTRKSSTNDRAPQRAGNKKVKPVCLVTGQALTMGDKPQRIPKDVTNDNWFGSYWEASTGSARAGTQVFSGLIKCTVVPSLGRIKGDGTPDTYNNIVRLTNLDEAKKLLAGMVDGLKIPGCEGDACCPYRDNGGHLTAEIECFVEHAKAEGDYKCIVDLFELAYGCFGEVDEWAEYVKATNNGAFDTTPCDHYADYVEWATEKASDRELQWAGVSDEERGEILEARAAKAAAIEEPVEELVATS